LGHRTEKKNRASHKEGHLAMKKIEQSPSAVQTTVDDVGEDDCETIAIQRPNGSLVDHLNYRSMTRARGDAAQTYFQETVALKGCNLKPKVLSLELVATESKLNPARIPQTLVGSCVITS